MSKMTQEEYLQEFALMVSEISNADGAEYNALCRIAESFLKPYIERQCSKYSALRNLNIESDVYHDVLVELIKSCVDKFLYRDDKLNDDPEGFLKWIYTVARNIINDCAKKYGARSGNEVSIVNEEGENIDIPSQTNPLTDIETRETLKECFRAVMNMECEIYIVFTWLLRVIVLSKCDMNTVEKGKKDDLVENKANEIVVNAFQNLTLSEIYTVILIESKHLPLMNICQADNIRILEKLSAVSDGIALGDRAYKSFFMKKGGKATVSDWVYRVNTRILKALDPCGQKGAV